MFDQRDPLRPGEYDHARGRASEALDEARRVTMTYGRESNDQWSGRRWSRARVLLAAGVILVIATAVLVPFLG